MRRSQGDIFDGIWFADVWEDWSEGEIDVREEDESDKANDYRGAECDLVEFGVLYDGVKAGVCQQWLILGVKSGTYVAEM